MFPYFLTPPAVIDCDDKLNGTDGRRISGRSVTAFVPSGEREREEREEGPAESLCLG